MMSQADDLSDVVVIIRTYLRFPETSEQNVPWCSDLLFDGRHPPVGPISQPNIFKEHKANVCP
jgi:hypothetical protein